MDKHWLKQAVALLQASRDPVPHEINEIDWKVDLDFLPHTVQAFGYSEALKDERDDRT